MKNTAIAVLSVLAAALAHAAQDDTLLTFSTPGVDLYADGSRVLNGECYALVWTKDGASFGGLTADAKTIAETDRLVLVAPLAKAGRCPTTVLELDAAAAREYEGGTFSLYLLDTRVRNDDGRVALAPFRDGAPQLVNSLGAATDEGAAPAAGGKIKASAPVRLGSVGVYTEIEQPRITSIRVESATVTIEVDRMSPTAEYFVVPGSAPGSFAPALDAKAEGGAFTFPKPEGASFFKVIGVRKF